MPILENVEHAYSGCMESFLFHYQLIKSNVIGFRDCAWAS